MSNPFTDSDESLVGAAQTGDRDAVERLLAIHQP
jgi:hypothetical protein